MPTLALQTDSRGVAAVLLTGGKAMTAVVPLADEPGPLVEALRAALPKAPGKLDIGVALGPGEAAIRRLTLPPAPAEETPLLAEMQASREAGRLAEELAVDYQPAADADGGETLVAWCDAERIAFWADVAQRLGGRLVSATPRCAAALGLLSTESGAVVTVAGSDLDIAATSAGAITLARTARQASTEAAVRREWQRTRLALGDDPAAATVWVDPAATFPDESSGARVEELPLPKPQSGEPLRGVAAAAGLAVVLERGDAPTLNLADPRRPPAAETSHRRVTLLAAAAMVALAAGGWMAWGRVAALDRAIAEQQALIDAAQDETARFDPYRQSAEALDAWLATDVTWLDEVDRLSQKLRPQPLDAEDFPIAEDLRLTQLVATAAVGSDESGGRFDVSAVARASTTEALEARVRDATHAIEPVSTIEAPGEDAYRYKYTAVIRVPAERDEAEDTVEDPADGDSDEEDAA